MLPIQVVLLCIVCCLPADAAETAWYKEEYEYNYVEAIMLIVFVILAVSFETVWHALSHFVEGTYQYGKHHQQVDPLGCNGLSDNHGNVSHTRLWEELFHRAGAEFMSLGVLAFAIFTFNQAGGFKFLAKSIHTGHEFHFPGSYEDYLHMAEIVHIKLFIGMVLYFGLVSMIVRGTVRKIGKWEKLRLRRIRNLIQGKTEDNLGVIEGDLADYCLWRNYFIFEVGKYKKIRPCLYREILWSLDLDPDDQESHAHFAQAFGEQFAFSAYLACCVEQGMRDTIEFHQVTWLSLLVIFGVFAILHRYARVRIMSIAPVFIGLAVISIVAMYKINRHGKRRIKRYMHSHSMADPAEAMVEMRSSELSLSVQTSVQRSGNLMQIMQESRNLSCHEKFETEMAWVRYLQATLFIVAYSFSRTLLDFHAWSTNTIQVFLLVALFASIFVLLGRVLMTQLPLFLALWALPPYVDHGNLKVLFAVLLDEHSLPDAVRAVSNAAKAQKEKKKRKKRSTLKHIIATELTDLAALDNDDEAASTVNTHGDRSCGLDFPYLPNLSDDTASEVRSEIRSEIRSESKGRMVFFEDVEDVKELETGADRLKPNDVHSSFASDQRSYADGISKQPKSTPDSSVTTTIYGRNPSILNLVEI